MANIRSFLKLFKKKKKNETKPKVVPKTSLSVTKPKQINSGLKVTQNSGFQSKTPQKLSEKVCDLKTSKTQSTRKQSIEEKERRIELVGNYLKGEDNQNSDIIPVRPQRKHSKNLMVKESVDTLKENELNSTDPRERSQMITNKINTSFDSIIEMNSNRVIKTDEKFQKTANQLKTTQQISEDLTTNANIESNSKDLVTSKSNFDFVDSELNDVNVNQNSLHLTKSDKIESKAKLVSGLVPIRDIDLKVVKCVVCLRLVSKNINITICSHIFCAECLRQWLRYSQHCPECRTFISSFGHSIRTQFHRICIRSEKDYKVMRISRNDNNFVDSLGAAYLFEAFLSNREVSKYLDSNIANICTKISDLESKLSTNGSVQRNVNIRYKITEENHKLEEMRQKKRRSEESFKEICNQINPQMLAFWEQVVTLRVYSVLSTF